MYCGFNIVSIRNFFFFPCHLGLFLWLVCLRNIYSNRYGLIIHVAPGVCSCHHISQVMPMEIHVPFAFDCCLSEFTEEIITITLRI